MDYISEKQLCTDALTKYSIYNHQHAYLIYNVSSVAMRLSVMFVGDVHKIHQLNKDQLYNKSGMFVRDIMTTELHRKAGIRYA